MYVLYSVVEEGYSGKRKVVINIFFSPHGRTMHFDTIKVFIYQMMHKRFALKNIKIYIKTAPTCFGAITVIRQRIL